MAVLEKGNKKLLNAWAFYDWANSVYPLVISSAVFPIFYGALTIIKDIGFCGGILDREKNQQVCQVKFAGDGNCF